MSYTVGIKTHWPGLRQFLGQIGLEHRIGGLEKGEDGGVSYDPENHEEMSLLRAKKLQVYLNPWTLLKFMVNLKVIYL